METLSQDQVLDIITQDKFEAAVQFLKVYPELRHWLENIDFMRALADKYNMVHPGNYTYAEQLENFNKLDKYEKSQQLVRSNQIDTLRNLINEGENEELVEAIFRKSSLDTIKSLMGDLIRFQNFNKIMELLGIKQDPNLLEFIINEAETQVREVTPIDLYLILLKLLKNENLDTNLDFIEELLKRGVSLSGQTDRDRIMEFVYDPEILRLILKYRADQLDIEDKEIIRAIATYQRYEDFADILTEFNI